MAEESPLTIGEVINLLREEFPDVSVSKVRFLESQGLLDPGRSEGGYRLFDDDDIDRIKYILRQQRDHFLPLKVIKSKLTLWERGEEPAVTEPSATPTHLLREEDGEPVTLDALVKRSGLTHSQVASLEEHRLIASLDGPSKTFPPSAVTIASEAKHLFEHGLESRHLRAIRHAAEREADVLAQLTAALSRVRNAEAREQARNILAGAGDAMVAIHRTLLAEELRKLIDR
jgi:DNA-binding transcriptional MerR regulator